MKIQQIILTVSMIILLGANPVAVAKNGNAGGTFQQAGGYTQSVVSEALSDQEIDDLVFMGEEEKLARDVYITLYEKWGHPVFSNISHAEQRHMDSLAGLLYKYGIADPVLDEDDVGGFENEVLADLYDYLIGEGVKSLPDALKQGAWIEEIDIRDLLVAIEESRHSDLTQAYENLMRGSRNHLRAFVRQIEGLGEAYEARELTAEAMDAILKQPMERGQTNQKGNRKGGRSR